MPSDKKPFDLHTHIRDKIVAKLRAGVSPWRRPWSLTNDGSGMPRNGFSKREYHGINVVLLWLEAEDNGYTSNDWFTIHQANQLGGKIRKGEHGSMVTFLKRVPYYPTTCPKCHGETGRMKKVGVNKVVAACGCKFDLPTRGMLRYYLVWNRNQIEGLPAVVEKEFDPFEVDAAAESWVTALVDQAGLIVKHGGNKAFNDRHGTVQMPKAGQFESTELYYATLFHEIGHWTGDEPRLNRPKEAFGTVAYAQEELVAEMFSAFRCGELGYQSELRHPEYIGHWIQVLNDDSMPLFIAAAAATRALEWCRVQLGQGASDDTLDDEAEAA